MTSSKQKDFVRTIEIIYARTEELVREKPVLLEARRRYIQERTQTVERIAARAN
jgi:hypothetical protein